MHSDNLRAMVNEKRNLGKTYRQIAEELCLTISSIQSLIKYEKKVHKKKSGPKCKISKPISLKLKRFIANENNTGHKVTCNKIIAQNNLPVCRRTVNNWLLKNEFRYQKQAQKILLSKAHKKRRMNLISSWIQESLNWENTIFTDEKRFCLDGPDNW